MILKIILIALGFGITVFIHELGHFIMARRAGVRVEVFSIGFGPKLFTFLERGGTKYILSLIPLGGYVKMLGQDDLPSKQKKEISEDHYLAKTPLQRMGIICAGVVMNSILAYVLMISALWIGIDFIAPEVGKVEVGSPAAQKGGFEPGDIIREMNGKPIDTFIDVKTNVALAGRDKQLHFTVERDGKEKKITVVPEKSKQYNTPRGLPSMQKIGIVPAHSPVVQSINEDSEAYRQGIKPGMEILSVRFVGEDDVMRRPERISFATAVNPGKKVEIKYKDAGGTVRTVTSVIPCSIYPGFMTTPVVGVIPDGPAHRAGLETGDIVTAIYGRTVNGWADIHYICAEIPEDTDRIKVQVKRKKKDRIYEVESYFCRAEGRHWLGLYLPGELEEYRDLARTVYYIEPELNDRCLLQTGDIIKEVKPKDTDTYVVTYSRDGEESTVSYPALKGRSGLLMGFGPKRTTLRKGVFTAFGYSFVRYWLELKRIYIFLYRLITGGMSPEMIGGPVQIANITYKVADFGFGYFLYLFSLIGLSLAVINILPVPVLDGGILVFLIYEMIRGKPASEKVQVAAQYAGLALLLILIVFVTYNDIMKVILQ